MTPKIARISLMCALLFALAACSPLGQVEETESVTSYPVDITSQSTNSAYPSSMSEEPAAYPLTDLSSAVYEPYPQPSAYSYEAPPLVTPDPAMGSVTAVILFKGEPLPYTTFFLADVLKSDKTGLEAATSLDRSTAPRVVSDQDGRFTFNNVSPGRYGLILISGIDTYLLLYPDRQEAILLTVEAGKQFDLGEINFEDLPLE